MLKRMILLIYFNFQIQQNRQLVSSLKRKNSTSSEELMPPENSNKISPRWNSVELLLAVQGVRKFGKDFEVIILILYQIQH